jgi:hypothetical protein
MSYKVHKDGKLRSRVSFEVSPAVIVHVNAICERDKKTFAAVCTQAVLEYVRAQGLTGSVPLPELPS